MDGTPRIQLPSTNTAQNMDGSSLNHTPCPKRHHYSRATICTAKEIAVPKGQNSQPFKNRHFSQTFTKTTYATSTFLKGKQKLPLGTLQQRTLNLNITRQNTGAYHADYKALPHTACSPSAARGSHNHLTHRTLSARQQKTAPFTVPSDVWLILDFILLFSPLPLRVSP